MFAMPWGGSEELWAAAADTALEQGHEVDLFLYRWPIEPPAVRHLREKGARVHLRARHDANVARLAFLHATILTADWRSHAALSTFRVIERRAPDIVCISQGDVYSGARENSRLVQWLKRSSTPYVVLCQYTNDHERVQPVIRERARNFFAGAVQVVFVAEANRRAAERQLGLPLEDAVVLPNPVNLHDRSTVPWPATDNGKVQLANVAKLAVYAKGQDVLLETLASQRWRERNWQLNLYGEGLDFEHLRTLRDHYGLRERVAFRGFAPDIRSVWADNHALVMPSRAEGIPLSVVEAMLCGRPVLATDVGGHREWLTDGETGWIAKAPTPWALDEALERAWNHRPRWADMGARAHEVASERADPAAGRRLLNVLMHCARRSRGPRPAPHASPRPIQD